MAFPSRSALDPGSPRSGFARARPVAGCSPSETVRRCIRPAPHTPKRWRLERTCGASARAGRAESTRVGIFDPSQSLRNWSRPLASPATLTYRAARRIATCGPGGGLRSGFGRGCRAAGASAVQEYLEREGNRKRAAASFLCRGGHRLFGRAGRRDFAEWIVPVSFASTSERTAMNRTNHKPDPWSVPVTVAQIPETGLHREIEADAIEREAMAEVAGLREILLAHAALDVTPKSGGRVHVGGHVPARIGQTCVVTLDPIENEIDEPIDLIFAPPEQIPQLAHLVDEAVETGTEIPDPPEPIVNGIIGLGRLSTEPLFLVIHPYPGTPYAAFEPPVMSADP